MKFVTGQFPIFLLGGRFRVENRAPSRPSPVASRARSCGSDLPKDVGKIDRPVEAPRPRGGSTSTTTASRRHPDGATRAERLAVDPGWPRWSGPRRPDLPQQVNASVRSSSAGESPGRRSSGMSLPGAQGFAPWARLSRVSTSAQSVRHPSCSAAGSPARAAGARTPARSGVRLPVLERRRDHSLEWSRASFEDVIELQVARFL